MKREINLLPEKYKNIKQKNRLKRLKKAGTIMLAFFVISSYYVPLFLINKLTTESDTLKTRVAGMKGISDYRVTMQELEKDLERRQKILKVLQPKGNEWSKIITEIGQKVPEGMELTLINFTNDGNLKVSGQARNCNLISQLLVNLQNLDIVSEIEPINIIQQQKGLYGFEINCIIINGRDKDEAE